MIFIDYQGPPGYNRELSILKEENINLEIGEEAEVGEAQV